MPPGGRGSANSEHLTNAGISRIPHGSAMVGRGKLCVNSAYAVQRVLSEAWPFGGRQGVDTGQRLANIRRPSRRRSAWTVCEHLEIWRNSLSNWTGIIEAVAIPGDVS